MMSVAVSIQYADSVPAQYFSFTTYGCLKETEQNKTKNQKSTEFYFLYLGMKLYVICVLQSLHFNWHFLSSRMYFSTIRAACHELLMKVLVGDNYFSYYIHTEIRVLLKTCCPLQEYKKKKRDFSILHPVLPRDFAIQR